MTPAFLPVAARGVRLFHALIAVLVVCFGPAPSTAAAPTTNAELLHGYTYDCNRSAESCDAAAERGPLETRERGTTHETVDCWLHGVLACPDGTTPGTWTRRTTDARLVRVAPVTATTREPAEVGDAGLTVFVRPGVAAETAPELASGLERTGTALSKSDAFHRSVSWVVDNPAAQRFAIKGGDGVGRELYQLPGEVNGKSGVFEWIIDRSGTNPVINHQRFIPGGSVTGYPNQVVP